MELYNPSAAFGAILQIFFPKHCLLCKKLAKREALCWRCLPALPQDNFQRCAKCAQKSKILDQSGRCNLCLFYPLPFREQRYIWPYQERHVQELVNIMKYRPSLALATLFSKLVAKPAIESFSNQNWDFIIAVPSSAASFLARTFNPALEIAIGLQRAAPHSRLKPNAIKHLGSNAAQASLPVNQRIENVAGSFRAESRQVRSKEILLVDDVVTSGATSYACALALLDAGASAVDLFSLCRSLTWPDKRAEVYTRLKTQREQAC